MKKLFLFILVLLVMFPAQVIVAKDTDNMYIEEILNMYEGVTEDELLKEISAAAESSGKSEEDIAMQIYEELSYQEELFTLEAESGTFSTGEPGSYTLDPSETGDIYYETAKTSGINHGHVGLYYSSSTLIESVPSDGVRTVSRTNKKVDTGARILAVNPSYATTTDKSHAADWSNSRVGIDSYSYNFSTNRYTSCYGDKNCSKLVWCAYIEKVGIDLDHNGGMGVYPKDIRDSEMVYTIRSY